MAVHARTVMRSVRFRITAMAALAVGSVLAIAGLLLLQVQRDQLTDNLDNGLRSRADDLRSIELRSDPAGDPVVVDTAVDDTVFQIVTLDGAVLAGTADTVGLEPLAAPPDGVERLTTVASLPVEDDEYRVLSRRVDGAAGSIVIHVAVSTDDVRDLVGTLRSVVVIAVPLAVALLSAVVWWLVGRTLRPVELIRSDVASLSGRDLSRRVPEPGTGDEIDRLAATMNAMLARVEEMSSRQQGFVADASHELRTPLARLGAELDVASPASPADVERLLASARAEVDGMAALVDDLLVLARSDAGAGVVVRRPVDVDDLVFSEADTVRGRGDLVVDLTRVSAAHVSGDAAQLRRVVRNLLDNAARHARTRIEVELYETGDGRIELVVTDDGPGIAASDALRVFDRFTRLDEARAAGTGGTGLGLAIVRDIVERHGGTVGVDAEHRDGARFVVELPTG